MKKMFFITVFTTVFTIFNTNAQQEGSFEMGADIGVNFANLRASANGVSIETNSTTGFNFAVTGEYYFSDTWGLKTKLIYDQKGWGNGFLNNEDTGERVTSDYTLTYLTLPVMANWHFGSTKKWYLNFGLYLGFLLDAKIDVNDIDVSKGFEGTDVGLSFGIGYKFPIDENTKMFVEFDGQGGFSSIFAESSDGSTARNSRSALNLGILFDL